MRAASLTRFAALPELAKTDRSIRGYSIDKDRLEQCFSTFFWFAAPLSS
jgi:hypothetical protein